MTWTDLSIKCFKLHEYEYLDHTYSPQPDKYPFRGNIKKKSKFVFFRIYRLSEIFFAVYKQETSKLYPWQLPRLPLC